MKKCRNNKTKTLEAQKHKKRFKSIKKAINFYFYFFKLKKIQIEEILIKLKQKQ